MVHHNFGSGLTGKDSRFNLKFLSIAGGKKDYVGRTFQQQKLWKENFPTRGLHKRNCPIIGKNDPGAEN